MTCNLTKPWLLSGMIMENDNIIVTVVIIISSSIVSSTTVSPHPDSVVIAACENTE